MLNYGFDTWFAPALGLHQNWMRDYDATLGRYIQADPLGLVDGASVYGYALQNPARWSDPRGEFVFLLPIVGVAVGGAGVWGEVVTGAAIAGIIYSIIYPSTPADGTMPSTDIPQEGAQCTSCPPCRPYAAGTIGYIGPHTDHTHYPYKDHFNLFKVNQDPSTCKCNWNKNKPDSAGYPPNADPSWVDLNYGFPPLSP